MKIRVGLFDLVILLVVAAAAFRGGLWLLETTTRENTCYAEDKGQCWR